MCVEAPLKGDIARQRCQAYLVRSVYLVICTLLRTCTPLAASDRPERGNGGAEKICLPQSRPGSLFTPPLYISYPFSSQSSRHPPSCRDWVSTVRTYVPGI